MPWITIKSCRGEDNYARDCIKRGLKDRGKNDIGRIRDKETDDPMIARFFSEAHEVKLRGAWTIVVAEVWKNNIVHTETVRRCQFS
jgi:hypothetical protein